MKAQEGALVLEILKQENNLSMSLFESAQLASTIRHYSQWPVSFTEINKFCLETNSVLNKAAKPNFSGIDLNNDLKKSGQLLWDHLLSRSVKERLKNASGHDLTLFLDEELIHIPWEILYDGQDFLCLKFNLGRLVRTREQLNPIKYRSIHSSLKMLVLANPNSDLKSAYLEGLGIKNQFDRKAKEIKIDFKSTYIDTLYVKKNLRDYDIVHFAGHCEYDDADPDRTGWVLSDGRLTALDIVALGESTSLPSLVFSNSCNSAKVSRGLVQKGYQEKTYSLASAFLFSGVRHYIGTTWKIEDPVSYIFAKEFYQQLIKGGSVGSCVRQARLALAKETAFSGLAWANYLLYGDPNFALFSKDTKAQAAKPRKKIILSKKIIRNILLGFSILALGACLYLFLPSLNPSTYFLFNQANKLFTKGKNEEVISAAAQIIARDPLFLKAYPLIADAYQRRGEPENALKYYFDYAMYSQKKQDKHHLACAYTAIGWVYQGIGEYAKAFDFYNQAITLAVETKDKLNEAVALRKLAVWYIDKEDYDKALELLTKSSEINRERQNFSAHKYNLACDYFDIGFLFSDKNDFSTAREFYRKSQQLFEQLKAKAELSDYYFNLGEIYLFEKQYQKALDCYKRGLSIDQAHNNKPSIAGDYNMIGELYMEIGNLDEAESYFNQALSIAREIKAPLEQAASYYNFGFLYKQKRQALKAREYLRQAQAIYRAKDLPAYQKIKQEFPGLDNP